jgi:hypothetical protein
VLYSSPVKFKHSVHSMAANARPVQRLRPGGGKGVGPTRHRAQPAQTVFVKAALFLLTRPDAWSVAR